MKLRELYKAILQASGAVLDEDGLVSMTRPGEQPVPLMVGDKRLALPTEKLLNAGAFNEGGSLIAFHPMCENVVLETSPVLSKLETAMAFRLTWVLRELIMQLVTIAANPKLHKKMKTREHGLLSALPDADEKTRDTFIKVMESTTTTGQKKLLSLYVRKGGTYGGEKVNRLARFFPSIIDQLDIDERKLLGTQLRKADVPAFQNLIEYILPEYRDPDKYASPTNSLVAPTFHALAKTYAKVANQLNKIVDLHASHLNDPESLKIDTDWVDAVHDLNPYRELIPVLPGNDGAEGTKTVKAPPAASAAPAFGKPAGVPASPAKSGAKTISVDEMLRGLQPQRQQFAAPQTRGWGSPAINQADVPPWAREVPSNQWGAPQTNNFRSAGGFHRGGGSL